MPDGSGLGCDAVMPLVAGVQACCQSGGVCRSSACLRTPDRALFLSQVRAHVPSVGGHAQPGFIVSECFAMGAGLTWRSDLMAVALECINFMVPTRKRSSVLGRGG